MNRLWLQIEPGNVREANFDRIIPWQITPRMQTEAMAAGGDEAKRAFTAMMKKIDVAAIKAARRG